MNFKKEERLDKSLLKFRDIEFESDVFTWCNVYF